MDYIAHNCPNCGAKLPTTSENGMYTCEYCGQSVRINDSGGLVVPTDKGASKATLTFAYDASHYAVVPDMNIIVKDKKFTIKNHKKLDLVVDKGEYDFKFRSSIRRKKLHLNVDKDIQLQIGWNRLTGKIVVEIEQPTQYL